MIKLTPTIRGLVGEYLAHQYLISEHFDIRNYGSPPSDSKMIEDEKLEKKVKIRKSGIKQIYEYAPNPIDYCYRRERGESKYGYTDGDRWKEKYAWTYGSAEVKKVLNFFVEDEKKRKNDVFYWRERDMDKWLDFIDGDISNTKENFYRLNMLISHYIDCLLKRDKYSKKLKLDDYDWIGNNWPGKYDVIGYKKIPKYDAIGYKFGEFFTTGEYYAIEIKVNTSTLSHPQIIRLGLLQKYGFNVMVVNVKISEEKMINAVENDVYEYDEMILNEDVDLSKVKFFKETYFKQFIKSLHKYETKWKYIT